MLMFTAARMTVRNNLWDWQSLSPDSGPGTLFFQFCDALEVATNGTIAPASGFGLNHALDAWSSFFNTTYLPLRPSFISALISRMRES
jgi:hypothetical protein